MSIVQHIKVLDSQLANIKIVAGSTIYTRDTGKHFIDISDTERVQISDIIYIDTDKERSALLAPLPDKLYITRDTNKVWVYSVKTDKWVCLNIDTTYTAGTGINISGTTINNSGVRAVTAGASANKINVNTNGNTNTITIDNVANAVSASNAASDSAGQQINTTYIKELSVSGKVITYTKGDGTTGTITTQDTDTWRGIQNVLTSDSTTDSLSAAQGKVLKGLVDSKSDKATTLAGYGITDSYTKTEVDNKVNVRSSSTLPDDAPDGTIIINPDECSKGFNVSMNVDTALSATSTNPVQNKVVKTAIDTVTASIPNKVSTLENDAGYLTQHQSLDGYAKTSVANTWTEQQNFHDLILSRERYTTYGVNGTSFTPTTSTIFCTATGAFTLNLATLTSALSNGQSSVFTAYFAANADYTLTITNAGTIKYIGSASDVAITGAGLLLNIFMTKDADGNLTSIVQASKLS